jgi:hypothetical protein
MTTSAARRRRSTLIGLGVTVLVVALAAGITAVGAATLVNSREGRDASADALPELELPFTPTALLAVVDDAGRLTSLAALVLSPGAIGGSIVSIAAIADSSNGLGDDRFPLAETLELQGPEAFRQQVEAMTAISFDVVEIADAARFAELVGPVGDLDVSMPVDVVDDDADGDVLLAEGDHTLTPEESAGVVTAFTASQSDRFLEPARDAIWSAVAAGVGAGVGSAPGVDAGEAAPVPASTDAFVDQLFAGQVGWRGLSYDLPDAAQNPRNVDVLVPDRAEMLLVFGQIAPARVGAPNPSHSFRIESAFTDDDLASLGMTAADLAYDAIKRILFVQGNVVSVVSAEGDPPTVSQALVADPTLIPIVEDLYSQLFGELEVVQADYRIEGIDVVLVLGQSYVEFLEEEAG